MHEAFPPSVWKLKQKKKRMFTTKQHKHSPRNFLFLCHQNHMSRCLSKIYSWLLYQHYRGFRKTKGRGNTQMRGWKIQVISMLNYFSMLDWLSSIDIQLTPNDREEGNLINFRASTQTYRVRFFLSIRIK